MKYVYLGLMVLGTALPWYYFGQYLIVDGHSMSEFFSSWSANNSVRGVLADLSIAGLSFLVWATIDAQRNAIKRWWLMFPALMVGFSLAVPLYLYLRETQLSTTR